MANYDDLAQALASKGAAFGVFPQMGGRRRFQDPKASADVPFQALRGSFAGLLGMLPDVANFMGRSPMPTEALGEFDYGPRQQLPYGTEFYLKELPLAPTSPVGQLAGQIGSFVPLSPMPAVRAGKGIARMAGQEITDVMSGFPPRSLLGQLTPKPLMLDVYHGTPHTLPPTERNPLGEFDASKIGTGEGAQAYGYGIYTAEAPAVAKGYQVALAPEKNVSSLTDRARFVRVGEKSINPDTFDIDISQELIDAAKLGKNEFINFANQRKSRWQELASDESYKFKTYAQDKLTEYNNLIKEAEKSGVSYTGGGNLYKADLPDAMIPKMLDYDKHLSEQSAEVQKILLPYQKEIGSSFGTGEQTLKAIAFERRMKGLDDSPSAVAQQLKDMGITGVRYLDEASRGTNYRGDSAFFHAATDFKVNDYSFDDALDGMKKAYKNATEQELRDALDAVYTPKTSNFVVFPGLEQNLTILERNAEKITK